MVWPPWRYVGRDRYQAVVPFEAQRASSTPLLLTSPVTTSGEPSPFTSTGVGVVKRTLALLSVQMIEPVALRRTTLGAFVDTTTLSLPLWSTSATCGVKGTLCPEATRVRHFRFP